MDEKTLNSFLETAVTAARLSGDVILRHLGRLGSGEVMKKMAFDYVTTVDKQSEAVIMSTISRRFPSHSFLAEESPGRQGTGDYRWIIDPLDGTTNYIHGYPVFSVSIALEHAGEIIAGVVFDPLRNELFHSIKGGGSFLNDRPIKVSDMASMEAALIATGFPFRKKEALDSYLEAFRSVFLEVSDLRRAGSAAIDLAYVAAGRLDGFFELNLSPWDIAAGGILITEAGGRVTDFGGGGDYLSTGNVVAGNKHLHAPLLKKIRNAFRDEK